MTPTSSIARCAHAPASSSSSTSSSTVCRNQGRRARGGGRATRARARAGTNFELLLPGDDAFERISANAAASDAAARAGKQNDAIGPSSVSSVSSSVSSSSSSRARGIVARWRVDARFGRKTAATDALREWAREIAPAAGIDPDRFTFYSSHIGGRDCAIEMEIDGFESVGAVDAFFAAIPREPHVEWTRAFAEFVVDGSTEWVIMRTSGAGVASSMTKTKTPPARAAAATSVAPASRDVVDEDALVVGQILADGREVVADWKGDPMVLNPGDRMPRF